MPNIKSAEKRMRQSARLNARNRSVKARIATNRRQFFEAVAGGKKEDSMQAFRVYASALDKAAGKGIIKKNTADRRKARAAAHLVKIAS